MNRNKWVWGIVLILLAAGGLAFWRWSVYHPLPAASEIGFASARFYHRQQKREQEVEIPEKHLPQLLELFQPATKAGPPGDWGIWGTLKIVTKDNRQFKIALFDTGESNVYEVVREEAVGTYVGGNRRALEALLNGLVE